MAASFETSPTSIESTYDYEKTDLRKSYLESKSQTKKLKIDIAKTAAKSVGNTVNKSLVSKLSSSAVMRKTKKSSSKGQFER